MKTLTTNGIILRQVCSVQAHYLTCDAQLCVGTGARLRPPPPPPVERYPPAPSALKKGIGHDYEQRLLARSS